MNKSDTIAVIRSLLSSTSRAYSIYNLNKDFRNETGVDIPLFGYGSISDFLNSIPDTVTVTGVYPIQLISLVTNEKSAHIVSLVNRQKKNGSRNKLFSKRKSLIKEVGISTSFRIEEQTEPKMVLEREVFDKMKDKTQSQIFFDEPISLKALSLMEETIPRINARFHTQVGEYIEVCPCLIFSPGKFYFHFRKFKKKFHNFTKRLQIFYTAHEEIPYMVDEMVKPKQPCAVFHKIFSKAQWHRAEVQECVNRRRVIVNFVDYGNSMEVSKESMKYLHQSFVSFPRQAILGSLANIKPLKGQSEWSYWSIKRFHDLAFEKELIGGVVHINDRDGCIGMALSHTGDSEIHINDALVSEGYAEFDVNDSIPNTEEVSDKQSSLKTAPKPNTNENIQNTVCFFTSDYCSNARLRRMFSIVNEK